MGRLGLLGCLGALVLILLIGGGWYIGVRNHLVELDQQVQAQWAQVENDYQRRFDLIPNLVRTVQGAANFEKSTLQAVVDARSRVGQVQSQAGGPPGAATNLPSDPNAMAKFAAAQDQLSGALSRLLVVVERYPELKATEGFRELQSQLEGTENRIAIARRDYNEAVRDFNTTLRTFPQIIWAKTVHGGSKPMQLFQATATAQSAPTVDFSPTQPPAAAAPAGAAPGSPPPK